MERAVARSVAVRMELHAIISVVIVPVWKGSLVHSVKIHAQLVAMVFTVCKSVSV